MYKRQVRSPQNHVGVVHSSNLCTEITLNTNDKEIAVCNLCLLYTSDAADERSSVDLGGRRIIKKTTTDSMGRT